MQTRTQQQSRQSHAKRGIFKKIFKRSEGFINKFNNDWTMQSAGTLAYNLMVAIVPIAIAIIAIFGFTVGALDSNAQNQLINGVEKAFPSGNFSREILQVVFTSLKRNAGFLTILAILTSIFGGSRLFIAIEGCFDITYRTYPRGVIAQNVMAILMMLLFIVLVPLMVFASSVPALMLSFIQSTGINGLPLIAQLINNSFFLGAIGIVSGVVISWILFEAIFSVVPNQPISLKNSWRGALLSAVLLELFLALFPLYITHFMGSYIGTAGFAVILLVFFYYFAVILLLGAQINAYFAEHIQPLPNNLAAVLHDATEKHAAPPASEGDSSAPASQGASRPQQANEDKAPESARPAEDSVSGT